MGVLFHLLLLVPPLILFFLLKVSIKFRKGARGQNLDSKLPPGPWRVPVIGSMHHLVGSLPHHSLKDLARKYGPLMYLKLGEVSHIVVSSPGVAKEICKTHDITFAARPDYVTPKIMSYGGRDIVFAPYGDYWRQLRKICVMELLSLKQVRSFQSIREEEVRNLIHSISTMPGSAFNLSRRLYALSNNMTTRAVIGSRCRDQNTFLFALTAALETGSGFSLADLFPSIPFLSLVTGLKFRMDRHLKKVDRILNGIIQEHKERKMAEIHAGNCESEEEDLLDVLIRLQEEGGLEFPLTTENIKAVIVDMFAAGSETSSNVMEWVMSELMNNPKAMERAQSEVRKAFKGKTIITEEDIHGLSYLKLVIKETLRLHPPLPLLVPRECTKVCQVYGYEIPQKTRVFINAWAMGRDPTYWEDAESFKPERFDGSTIDFRGSNYEFIPFGAGRRMCPGMMFGLASIELALAQLLYYFDWRLPQELEANGLDMTELFRTTSQRKSELCLCAIPYVAPADCQLQYRN